jgi:transcriptional regulator with XRE-family HTH domain
MPNRVFGLHVDPDRTKFCTGQSSTLDERYGILYRMGRSDPKTFGERIALILEEANISSVELAKIARVTKGTVTEWTTGRSKSPRPEALFAIEDQLGYSARWLATGKGPKKIHRIDPTDSTILESVGKLAPDRKNAVQAFIDFELHRTDR